MSPAKRTTSSQGSISDNSGVPAASELFEAIQEWAARDPNAARETIELIRARAKGAPEPPKGPPLKKPGPPARYRAIRHPSVGRGWPAGAVRTSGRRQSSATIRQQEQHTTDPLGVA